VDIDLRCSKADTLGVVHGLGHILHQLRQFGIELLDRLGDGSEPLIRELQNFQFSHIVTRAKNNLGELSLGIYYDNEWRTPFARVITDRI
jgi:hypothetical protein